MFDAAWYNPWENNVLPENEASSISTPVVSIGPDAGSSRFFE
jgi:hypothetical protein